jgi:hypothetical protein
MPKLDPIEVAGYYRALGEFVEAFADVEGELFLYLYTLVGVDYNMARAVFSGVRVQEAVSFIRRIMEIRPSKIPEGLDEVLAQILIINDTRNLILHHSVSGRYSKGQLIRTISNIDRALTARRAKELPISEKILSDMTDDLFHIKTFLFHEAALLMELLPPETRARIERLGPVPVGAWLYKPAPRSTLEKHAPPKRRAKRTPPDESSRG